MGRPSRLAVIGAGRMAHAVHLPLLRRMTDAFEVVAVADPRPERAEAALHGFPGALAVPDTGAALAAGVDAVLCASPWYTHEAVLAECLAHGVQVLCEKPVTLDLDGLQALKEQEDTSPGSVTVGYMKRHDTAVRAFVAQVRAARGALRRFTVTIADPNSPRQIAHLVGPEGERTPDSSAAAQEKITRALGDRAASPVHRTAYAHGLGGSLIHHVNLAHAALGGPGGSDDAGLLGHLCYAVAWSDGTGVACGWRPAPGLLVEMSHLRTPQRHAYRETVEAVTDTARLVLTLPSPYSRDAGGTLTVEGFDESARHETLRTVTPEAGGTGFRHQLHAWADAVRSGDRGGLPGLDEALRDARVVRQAAVGLV